MLHRSYFSLKFALFISTFALMLWVVMPTEALIHLAEEGQLIESLTLYFYAAVLIMLMFIPLPGVKLTTRWSVIFVLFAMMAREADLHKAVDDMSMLKLRFWTGALPWQDKLLALAVLLPVVLACLNLLWRHSRKIWHAAKAHKAHAVTILAFISLIILTSMLDRSLGVVKETFGWHGPKWLVALQTSQEELLEMALPLLALVAVLQYRGSVRHAQTEPASVVRAR